MNFKTILNLSLVSAVFFLILTLTDVILTVAGWIFGDWFVYRIVSFVGKDGERFSNILIFYITSPTDACVVASTIGMAAAIVSIIAWTRVKKSEMDLDFNMPRRRFWLGFVIFSATATFSSAMAAFILHYTAVGSEDHGCNVVPDGKGGATYYCTRTSAACDLMPTWKTIIPNTDPKRGHIDTFCNLSQATKWFQLILAFTCLIVMGLFSWHAYVRRQTRYMRVMNTKAIPYEETV
ncbi:hypothetical protein K491DRAFT_694956 [Lophiostoma macrostomum CBS 122681]|uniref:Uncharacterized protein n=1 Tax=Lophiostoma macrostomum CBS 122681 TaxID=1314788 RepID=A0A6A6T1Z0_9PLEO|nr:hypothetical protein K491DRAFT_694956 [Lophiostoma macrostomum CBS 122681]